MRSTPPQGLLSDLAFPVQRVYFAKCISDLDPRVVSTHSEKKHDCEFHPALRVFPVLPFGRTVALSGKTDTLLAALCLPGDGWGRGSEGGGTKIRQN